MASLNLGDKLISWAISKILQAYCNDYQTVVVQPLAWLAVHLQKILALFR